jgi:hypothetical protein
MMIFLATKKWRHITLDLLKKCDIIIIGIWDHQTTIKRVVTYVRISQL